MTQSERKPSSIRFIYLLNMLPIVGLVVYYYTHYLEGTYSFIIPLGLTVAWLVLSMMTGRIKGLLFNSVTVWWMAYLFLCVMMVIMGFSSTNMNFIISRLPYYIIPAIGFFVIKNYNRKEQLLILTAFLVVYLVNLVYNIYLGLQFPDIFEEQTSSEISIEFARQMNIASTGFIIVGYCLIGTLLMTMLIVKSSILRLMCILLIFPIAYYMLFQNTRGTAILLLFIELVGLLLAYFEPKKQRNRKAFYLFATAVLVLLVLVVFIPLMSWLIENLNSERLTERFNDLVDFRMSGGDVNSVREGSFYQRVLLAQTSFNSFLSSPISVFIGIGDHTQSLGGDLIKSGIGGHSEFIDVLARYGLVGAIVFWNIMKNYYRMLQKQTMTREVLKYVNIIYTVFLISGIVNTIFFPVMLFFMYLLFPIIINFTVNK